MVRNVDRRGFSVVEVMVSMVILAIVVMIMSNILLSTTRSQGKASDDDAGDAIALEYLAKIQNKVINTINDSAEVTRDNQTYMAHWVVATAGTGLPSKAAVTVNWNSPSGAQESQIVGYVDLKNVCTDLAVDGGAGQAVGANLAIDNLLYEVATAWATAATPAIATAWASEATTITPPVISLSSISSLQVVKVKPHDGNGTQDVFTYTILTSQDRFVVGADGIIKTARSLNTNDVGTHKLKLQVFDCSGANPDQQNVETIEIKIEAAAGFPDVKDQELPIQNEKIDFTSPVDISLGTVSGTPPATKAIKWTTTSTVVTIDPNSGAVTLPAASMNALNFETQNGKITFPVTAELTDDATKKVTVNVSVPLKDLAENPSGIYLVSTPDNDKMDVSMSMIAGTKVCMIKVDDEDISTPKHLITSTSVQFNEWFNLSPEDNGAWSIRVKKNLSSTSPSIPNTIVFTLDVIDQLVLTANSKPSANLTFTMISDVATTCPGTEWASGVARVAGQEVKYSTTGSAPFRKYAARYSMVAHTPPTTYNPKENVEFWIDKGGCTIP